MRQCGDQPARGRDRGFTLVEMLVTMALLSLLMLGMASALRSMAQTEERVDQRVERADELRIAAAFLRTTMGRLSVRRTGAVQRQDESPFLFSGLRDAVVWVGIMPARHGVGGRFIFRLAVEGSSDTSALVIRFVPWEGQVAMPNWDQADSRVLVRGVQAFEISYEDMAQQVRPLWVDRWVRTDGLPSRVRIDVATRDGPWPLLVVTTRSLPFSDRAGGAFSSGVD